MVSTRVLLGALSHHGKSVGTFLERYVERPTGKGRPSYARVSLDPVVKCGHPIATKEPSS